SHTVPPTPPTSHVTSQPATPPSQRFHPVPPHDTASRSQIWSPSALQASGLALHRFRDDVDIARDAIEARLSLGLPAREAFLPHQRSALRTALLPAIDSTKVVGLISLPGSMTGLILAGVDPLTAIRYQIVVMYMLLAATALAALTTGRLAEHALFDHAHRLVPVTPPQRP
ncbi:MAG: ABC transporter permease, partial [Actinobacteria bacterium]|nr:ABC transporter permease [Actinomycetota bacterium]